MFQIIIAGGRDFNDYPLLERTVDQFLADVHDEITIFCGTARGADSLGERYAKSGDTPCGTSPRTGGVTDGPQAQSGIRKWRRRRTPWPPSGTVRAGGRET